MESSDGETPLKKRRMKPKVIKEWTEDDILKLISLVEKQTCLWNAAYEGYTNKTIRDKCWQHISEEFDKKYTPDDLKAKWTNLRIQYRGYASRSKTKSPPKWRYFNLMDFVGRAEDIQQQTQETKSNWSIEIDSERVDSESNFAIENSPSPSLLTPLPTSNPLQPQFSPAPPEQSAAAQIAETMREAVIAMKQRNQNALDPNTSFANYLLSELKTLSDSGSATVRRKVTLFFLQCVEEERNNDDCNGRRNNGLRVRKDL
ncbi:uncharacterized protein [Musca autumnalis]|uniref:uncharacterized protein n=1 Tax=Musca autumnalis TaxID=221902 RepID=UPI003CE876B4